ncbi:MAG: HEAT repeat domain-containing protein [Gammaproteobacteria bacterium]|nr:HEAT repeat domain-containing protein [Gammaproteobacteria bacterium]
MQKQNLEIGGRSRSSVTTGPIRSTPREHIVRDFVTRGLIVLAPDSLGIPLATHDEIYEKELIAFRAKERITATNIPDIMKVTNAPGVRDACELLIGKNYAIVPFTHNTPFMSGSHDQHWHKDDNGPYNMRKQRHHHAIQLEMLYYPQEVRADMGPTATVPYSQYWTFNHEENHDNFAGADHLDFDFQLDGMEHIPISGPNSKYAVEDIVNLTTDHDIRMRNAVLDLEWPLCQTYEVGPLKAGSVVLYSHNLLHRRNHRTDDWRTWSANPRFMWRFWLYRTTEPAAGEPSYPEELNLPHRDELTGQEIDGVGEDVRSLWRYQYNWSRTGEGPSSYAENRTDFKEPSSLSKRLRLKGDTNEPNRVGAAYRLAEHPLREDALALLDEALHSDRENVRRAALYGLIAIGEEATQTLLSGLASQARWVRKASAFGLGSAGRGDEQVIHELGRCLLDDPSTYVRSVAADALGCLGRRVIGREQRADDAVGLCASYLIQCLDREVNRLSMDRAQNRSIKMVRPTDDCDVCEGIGFDYGQSRYEPVRSVVRENALWALVILCSHGAKTLGDELPSVISTMKEIISEDKNVFSVGLAMDCLQRLVTISPPSADAAVVELGETLDSIFTATSIYSLEALVASGMSIEEAVSKYATESLTSTAS